MIRNSFAAPAIFLLAALCAASPAAAAPKVAVFPFELVIPPREEDFFMGASKPSSDEQARLKLAHQEFLSLVTAGGRLDAVDLAPLADKIEANRPLHECKGCEIDLARSAGADVAYLVLVEKASDTVLNLSVTELDVNKGGVLRNASAIIQGNTDSAWLGGVRWIVRNRLVAKQQGAP